METVRIQNGATERIESLILDDANAPLTGLSNVLLTIRRTSDDYWLDFNDNIFKASGWTTRQKIMTELDATNAPGTYYYDFNTTGFNNDSFAIRVDSVTESNTPQQAELKVGEYIDTLLENNFQGGAVWIDTVGGSSGIVYPFGTTLSPVNNFADALTIANARRIKKFVVTGSIIIGASDDISGMEFVEGEEHSTIILTSGCTTTNTKFTGHIELSGYFNGHVHCENSHLSAPSYNLQGFFDRCVFDNGNYSISNGGVLTRFIDSKSSAQQGQAISLSASGSVDLFISGWGGKLEIVDKDGAETFDITMASGEIGIESSCTNGRITIQGVAVVDDKSSDGCNVVTDNVITIKLDTIQAKTDNLPTDTEAEINIIQALCGKNNKLVDTTYDDNSNLISGTIKGYASKSDLNADINPILTLILTATYSAAGKATTHIREDSV